MATNLTPTVLTQRLELRPLCPGDATEVRSLAAAREVAATTLRIPHPYPEGAAEAWIESVSAAMVQGEAVVWAITLRGSGELVGAVGLEISTDHARAELGYWVGVPYWNRGYATEAAAALVEHAFSSLGLNRVFAHYFATNEASGRVMQKLGMVREGRLRQHVVKWGERIDLELYSVLRAEWDAAH